MGSERERGIYYDYEVYLGDLIYKTRKRKFGMGKDNFSLTHVVFVEMYVAFLRIQQWQDMGIYIKTLEKLQRAGTTNWDSLE